MNKKLFSQIAIIVIVLISALYLVIGSESAKITNFDECENAGWLLRSITIYDYAEYVPNAIEQKCTLWTGTFFVKETVEPPFIPPITNEPEPLPQTTKAYVYDEDFGYGFEYPEGWEFYINLADGVNGCDSELGYEGYTCVDFENKDIKKVILFESGSAQIDFTVQSATNIETITNEFKTIAEMSGLEVLSEVGISINNVYGYDTLTGTSGWKLRQVVFIDNGTVYIFKYSGQEESYDLNEDIFENMINSFNVQ
ncbi:MAG: hypothetical protein K0B02_01505 [DPANN group archaeon]|nr:hypothetical protein [DPANN group archaeon]